MQSPAKTLASVFGYPAFRPLQAEIVEAMLAGRDTFVLMPTGGGKSLCYQLPALLSPGLTVVVSPLIALMKDQVDRLHSLGAPATFINSSLEPAEIARRQGAVARSEVKLLYVAPERLGTPGLLRLLSSVPVSRFAIDEAHCISEWGHDFRPDYRQLGQLRKLFPETPVAAFTATATGRVQQDILLQLGLKRTACFRGSFNRPNLTYEVRRKVRAYEQLVVYLRSRTAASGIIYCLSRSGTEELAARLKEDGFRAASYHAGLDAEERRNRQEDFARDDTRIIVATIAFGMGIDKPDVRFVIHYDVPRNLESYYQESGRAGRDGDPADCLLFFSEGDVVRQQWFVDQAVDEGQRRVAQDQLYTMVSWAQTTECRRRALLRYFDEELATPPSDETPPRGAGAGGTPCCDNCSDPPPEVDYTVAAQKLLSAARRTGERYGVTHLVRILTGSEDKRVLAAGHDKLPTFGVGRDISRGEWRHVFDGLCRGGLVSVDPGEFKTVRVSRTGGDVLYGRQRFVWRAYRRADSRVDAGTPAIANPGLFDELRDLRKRIADERGVPPYVVFHDSVLRQMAAQLPPSLGQLRSIPGIGDRKLTDYGETFLEVIARYARKIGLRRGPVPSGGPGAVVEKPGPGR